LLAFVGFMVRLEFIVVMIKAKKIERRFHDYQDKIMIDLDDHENLRSIKDVDK
jgi:hypothetical protein